MLSCLRVLGGHAVNRVDKRSEVPASFEACSLVLVFLLFGVMLKDFAQVSVAVGVGVGVTDSNIEDSSASTVPEAVRKDISTCFIS